MAIETVAPDADSAVGGWTDQAGSGTNLFAAIDETSASNADYIRSPSVFAVAADLIVRLKQGATVIATWTHAAIPETFTDVEQTLTAPQIAAINDFADLFIEFDNNAGNVYRTSLGNPTGPLTAPVKVSYRYRAHIADPVILLTGTTVNEDAAVATTVGTLSIGNSYTGTPVYSLVDDAGGRFAISGSNLNVAAALDYETAETHSVTVAVSGITPAAANKAFIVVVIDVEELPGAPDSAAYSSFIARTSGLDANHTAAYKNLLDGLTTDGFFDGSGNSTLLDALWTFATQDLATCRLNLVANRNNCVNAFAGTTPPTFTPDQGVTWAGAPGGAGFNTDLNSSTAGLNATGSSYSFGVWCNTAGTTPTDQLCFGADQAVQGIYVSYGGTTYYRIQGDVTAVNPLLAGFYAANRNSTALTGYKNGTSVGTNTATAGSLYNGNWFAATNTEISLAAYVGASLNGTQHANLHGRLATYLAEIATGTAEGGGGGLAGDIKNIVTDYGAVGDAQWAQTTLSITTNVLTSATPIWSPGDVGKTIVVGQCGRNPAAPQGSVPLYTTITGYSSATSITLGTSAVLPLSSEPDVIVAWGTNDEAAFQAFKDDYQGDAVTLTIPAGTYLIATPISGNFGGLFDGIRNIVCNAAGATLCGGSFQIQAAAQYEAANHMAYTVSATAGTSFVTLTTPSQASRFAAGDYAMMTGFDMQHYGYPTNHSLWEYLLIAAIDSDAGSPTYGRITFATPLMNSYASTWPVYNTGGTNYGGPATLYAMNPNFKHTSIVNGLRVAHHAQWAVAGRSLTFNDCVFEGLYGPYPTMAKSVVFNNCTGLDAVMEVDKLVTSFAMIGCTWHGINMQSTAVDLMTLDNTDTTGFIIGSARKLVIENGCNLAGLHPGPGFFGYAHELEVSDSAVLEFNQSGGGALIKGATPTDGNGIQLEMTMAGGVITIPAAKRMLGVGSWGISGEKVFFYDVGRTIGSFTITDVTETAPAGDILIHTDWSGGFPARTYDPAQGLFLLRHPAPVCTFSNVTGCAEVVDLCNALAAGQPMNSYTKRTYTGSADSDHYINTWGRYKYLKVTVATSYTGSIGTVTASLGSSNNQPIKISDGTNAASWTPVVNLKIAGVRVFDATAGTYPVAWTGAQTGDVLPGQTEALWCGSNFVTTITDVSSDPGGTPMAFTVEMITDQGFAP